MYQKFNNNNLRVSGSEETSVCEVWPTEFYGSQRERCYNISDFPLFCNLTKMLFSDRKNVSHCEHSKSISSFDSEKLVNSRYKWTPSLTLVSYNMNTGKEFTAIMPVEYERQRTHFYTLSCTLPLEDPDDYYIIYFKRIPLMCISSF